jgi:hypothetical protein
MNDNDLERRLRSETGPREQGYVPAHLPTDLDALTTRRRPSPAARVAILVPAVAAGILAVAVAGAMLGGTGPGPILSGGSPTLPPAPTPEQLDPCAQQDVAFYADPWGGAAGSRGTVVNITLAEGRYPCVLGPIDSARIDTSSGATLIEARTELQDTIYRLESGSVVYVTVTWSNWCGETHGAVQLVLVSAGTDLPVDVPTGIGAMPPCNGESAPSTLSVH